MLVRREVLSSVGLMDESFFVYGEETEWQLRIGGNGWKILYCPNSVVWHKVSASSAGDRTCVDYWCTRNWIRITRRYTPWALPVAGAFHILRSIHTSVMKGKPSRGLAIVKGAFHGILTRDEACIPTIRMAHE